MRVVTGQIADVYNYEAEFPDEIIFAYSKHILFKCRITNIADNTPAVGLKITFGIALEEEYRYTNSNGEVMIDAARLIQIITNNREKELSSIMYDATDVTLWNMGRLYASFIMEYNQMFYFLGDALGFTIVNGAHDNAENWRVGHTSSRTAFRLQMWRKYPFTFDVGVGRIDYNLWGDPLTSSPDFPIRKTPVVDVPLGVEMQQIRITPEYLIEDRTHSKSTMWVRPQSMLTMTGDTHGSTNTTNRSLIYKIEINECPRSDSKTYLRWLGKHGEVFYWLFDNISEDWNVKSDRYHKIIKDDTFKGLVTNKMRDNGVIRDAQVTKTRVLATELIDNHYYEIVRSIAESPYVDMLIGEEGDEKWQRINVADGSFSRSLKVIDRAKQHRITLTIEIDEI